MINTPVQNKLPARALLFLLLFSVFLLPAFSLVNGMPKIQVAELLLPVLLILVFWKADKRFFYEVRPLLIILSLLALVIFLSMVVNHRVRMVRDYYEILKVGKYLAVVMFIALYASDAGQMRMFKVIFLGLILFNLVHYFNFLDFNKVIERYYGSPIQVETFGLNSLGQPDTKRMLGTMGNPNDNAVLFLFFVVLFFPSQRSSVLDKIFFYTSVFAVFVCQSRTGLIALLVVYCYGAFLRGFKYKQVLFDLVLFAGMFMTQPLIGNVYFDSMDGQVMQQHSVKSRWETWKLMLEMIWQKPLIGHAPYKEYFEDNNMYAENEYVLYCWRYGIAGLGIYLCWLGYTFLQAFRSKTEEHGFGLMLFTMVVGIVALTNTPTSNASVVLIFAVSLGLFYAGNLKSWRPE